MSDTPRTNEAADHAFDGDTSDYSAYVKMLNHSRQLERELASVVTERNEAREQRGKLTDALRKIYANASNGSIPDGRNLWEITQGSKKALEVIES